MKYLKLGREDTLSFVFSDIKSLFFRNKKGLITGIEKKYGPGETKPAWRNYLNAESNSIQRQSTIPGVVTRIIIYFFSAFMITTVILPLFRKDHWTFRIFEFPRLQKLVLFGVLLISIYWLLPHTLVNISLMGLHIVAIVHLLYLIFPFTPLAPKALKGIRRKKASDPIKLLISNVYQPNKQYHKLVRHIKRHQPDLVLLVETDQAWKEGMREIEKDYEQPLCLPLDNTYGMLLYTRLRIEDCELRYQVEEDIPSVKAFIYSEKGKQIRFYGLHPEPPSPTENPYSTERDAELLMVARECEQETRPIIVVGDLNDVAWSYTTDRFLRVSGLKDPRKGRGIFSTFNARNILMRWPLDHVFCSRHFRLLKMRRLRSIGSDHFPVLIELSLEED